MTDTPSKKGETDDLGLEEFLGSFKGSLEGVAKSKKETASKEGDVRFELSDVEVELKFLPSGTAAKPKVRFPDEKTKGDMLSTLRFTFSPKTATKE